MVFVQFTWGPLGSRTLLMCHSASGTYCARRQGERAKVVHRDLPRYEFGSLGTDHWGAAVSANGTGAHVPTRARSAPWTALPLWPNGRGKFINAVNE